MSNYFNNLNENTKDYIFTLSNQLPYFLYEYFDIPEIKRLKYNGYFCAMNVASKKIYNYPYQYSRFDHSFAVACIVWQHTHDKKQTLAAFLHDIANPATSHVNEYKNGDKRTQESSEDRTRSMMENSKELLRQLEKDGFTVEDIVDAKKYSLVDNSVPGLCADRLDGIFMTNAIWTREIDITDIRSIYSQITVAENENKNPEFAARDLDTARRLVELSINVGRATTSREDNLCMQLLADIVDLTQKKTGIIEDELFRITEPELFEIIDGIKDKEILKLWQTSINMEKIKRIGTPIIKWPWNYYAYLDEYVKKRYVDPLVITGDGVIRASILDPNYSGKRIEEHKAFTDEGWALTRICKGNKSK